MAIFMGLSLTLTFNKTFTQIPKFVIHIILKQELFFRPDLMVVYYHNLYLSQTWGQGLLPVTCLFHPLPQARGQAQVLP